LHWPNIDALGHVNNAAYLVFLNEAHDDCNGRALGRGAGWPNATVDDRARGARELTEEQPAAPQRKRKRLCFQRLLRWS
jgi:hypothetical protein